MSDENEKCVSEFLLAKSILTGASLLAVDHSRPGNVLLRCASSTGEMFYDVFFAKAVVQECDVECQPFFGKINSLAETMLTQSAKPRQIMQIETDAGGLSISHECFLLTTRTAAGVRK